MTLSFHRAIPFLSILFVAQVFAAGESAPRTCRGTVHFNGRIVESLCHTQLTSASGNWKCVAILMAGHPLRHGRWPL